MKNKRCKNICLYVQHSNARNVLTTKKYIISFIHGDKKKKHNTKKKYTHCLKQIDKRQQNKTTIDHQQQHIYISIDKFPRLYFGIAYF